MPAEKSVTAARPIVPREDLLPVILGGDISVYAYAREFHEAYGVRSVGINQAFIAVIEHSRIFSELVLTTSIEPGELLEKIAGLASADPSKRLVVVPSTDALVFSLDAVRDQLPKNVICPIPGHDALVRSCDKVEFAHACERLGLPTPETEIVSLAGSAAITPTSIEFPVVAKPARSAEYTHLYSRGFRKVYSFSSQDELDALWSDLREAGFSGEFLVQRLVAGDDTHM